MSPDAPSHGSPRRARARRPSAQAEDRPSEPDDIQDAYERRAITEMAGLNDEITAAAPCRNDDELPVLASGSPQADIMLVKWAPNLAERQEGVAFFGRAGSAVLKCMERLGIDPLTLYGTLCVKCGGGPEENPADGENLEAFLPWLSREVQIVRPALLVPMGERVVEAMNAMAHPMAEPLEAVPGTVQRWTPSIEALYVPDIDGSLDEQSAKRAFWSAFRAIGEWHQAQPPY